MSITLPDTSNLPPELDSRAEFLAVVAITVGTLLCVLVLLAAIRSLT